MNREKIRFKGNRKDNGKSIEGFWIEISDGRNFIIPPNSGTFHKSPYISYKYEIIPESLELAQLESENQPEKTKEICTHPTHQHESYHDGAIVCKKCNCIISQNGKTFDKPVRLSMFPEEFEDFASQQRKVTDESLNNLQKLMDDVLEWSQSTFKTQSSYSKLKHLEKENSELQNAIFHEHGNAEISEEFADCFMLLIAAAKMEGFSAMDLINCSNAKLEINKTRKWGDPDENGVCEHIKTV
jgi:hypothetical protein